MIFIGDLSKSYFFVKDMEKDKSRMKSELGL